MTICCDSVAPHHNQRVRGRLTSGPSEANFSSGSTAGLKSRTRSAKPKPRELVDLKRHSSNVTELHTVSQNLMTSRTGKVGEVAQRVTAAITAAKKGKQEAKPIAYLLVHLEAKVIQMVLAASSITKAALLENYYHKVRWLIDDGHYITAISLGRELYVTYVLLKALPDADYKDDGKRRETDLWLGCYCGSRSEQPEGDLLPLYMNDWSSHLESNGALSDRRNDVQHAGMHPLELTYQKIVGFCGEIHNGFTQLLQFPTTITTLN